MNRPTDSSADTPTWTLIALGHGDDAYTYWIGGIYKIVSYRAGEFLAYYMPDHYRNWGDYVSPPPDHGKYGKCWSSLESAQAACAAHAVKHTPKPRTVKRAADVKAHLISSTGIVTPFLALTLFFVVTS